MWSDTYCGRKHEAFWRIWKKCYSDCFQMTGIVDNLSSELKQYCFSVFLHLFLKVKRDLCSTRHFSLLSHLVFISVWQQTWSAHDESHNQCMISQVISAWSITWSLHDQSREQCMISHVISAWSVTWSVHDQPRDQCMISHVISVWSATWSVHDIQVISAG